MGSGALEALKWLALVSMVGDHVDAAFFNRDYWILSEAGRIAMPVFAAVFGYNLLRIAHDYGKLADLRNKLVVAGLIAWPFHMVAVSHNPWTLNILFAFAVSVQMTIWSADWRRNLPVMVGLFAVSGLVLEFGWVGPALVLTWANYFKRPSSLGAVVLFVCFVGLAMFNGNWWGFAAVPLIALVAAANPNIPRMRQMFWAFYPVHLAVLAVLISASHTGHVFPAPAFNPAESDAVYAPVYL